MGWDSLLYLSILGTVVAISVVAVVTGLGIRYRRELPKLPIMERLEALILERDREEANLAELQDELAQARMDIREGEQVSDFLETARPEMERLQTETREFQEAKARAERDAAAAQEDLEKRETQLQGLEESLAALQTKQATLQGVVEALKSEQERLDKECERLISSIEELKRVHSSAGGVDEDHDSRQDLWVPVFPKRLEPGGKTDEQGRLDQMAHQLKQTKVRIPRRTLAAFHTALKIQDISPLTVLAGISGTGKSLLPRLYSKCMGLHFLNLPVQPGWNSPQDLFGFYNYIEHRFKATPLARALVQFDQFSRDHWPLPPENESFQDQVLLVLLDEMNLARVEYYFSELLSRLETRRSIDVGDAEERQKVEIPLEIGHAIRRHEGKVEDISVSVYPGENVLFTGTMNEDESTMSLSDKVLDRATVLRFGRPAETVKTQPNMGDLQASAPLALSTWKRWLAPKDVQSEIKDAVEELGDIMARAGTPFGHRVAQGIRHYVSLYPDSTITGQRMALVDQVEQKILPKLRGRELGSIQDSIQQLSNLVRRMDDEELVNAIRDGQDQLEGTFMWIGLDRREG